MIFVTVGTHEAPFDRLVRTIERYAAEHDEPVVIQRGYSREPAPHCEVHALLSHRRIQELMRNARIVVCHAGPSTILDVLNLGRVPVVMPRDPEWAEHVDHHQVAFARRMAERVVLVEDEHRLADVLEHYDEYASRALAPEVTKGAADAFASAFAELADDLVRSTRARKGLRDTLASFIRARRGR